jgi:hypothetical protein
VARTGAPITTADRPFFACCTYRSRSTTQELAAGIVTLPGAARPCATIGGVSYDRSRELGDCCGFCLACGWGRRFMMGNAVSVPEVCPDCGGRVITACPRCGEPIASLMALTCRGCGQELRPPVLFGGDIRRKPERHQRLDSAARTGDNESSLS